VKGKKATLNNLSLASAQGFLRGEEGAIKEVYLAYRQLLYFIIASIVSNPEDAKDIYQETFVSALAHREDVKSPKDLKWYLVSTAKNLALNYVKKRDALIDPSDLLDYYGQEESNGYLEELNAFLKPKESVVVTLKIAYGFTNKEIARYLNVSERSVAALYREALIKLKKGISAHV
jgi:RNA polymerase sigma-70 factor (ECF subfamily)